MTLELGGKITIECEKTKCAAELEFKLKVLFTGTIVGSHWDHSGVTLGP